MPYIGVGVTDERTKSKITMKIHGPLDLNVMLGLNTNELRSFIRDRLESYQTSNIPTICERLSSDARDKFCDGVERIWVQVEIVALGDLLFGASAEQVLVS